MARKNGKKQIDRRPSPACDGTMVQDWRPDTVAYKHLKAKVTQPGWYCETCDEALLDAADVRATEAAFMDLKARTRFRNTRRAASRAASR